MKIKKKNLPNRFSRKMQKKLIFLSFLFFAFLIGLAARLMYIEAKSGRKYEKIVLNQQRYDNQTIPFKRGDILDRKGTILATSLDVYNVILDCRLINKEDERSLKASKEKKYTKAVQKALTQSLDVTEEELTKALAENKDSQYYKLRKKLPYETIRPMIEMLNDKKKNPYLTGIWFEKEYQRHYPFEMLGGKVLGYTTSGNVGIGGVEDYYNSTLNGTLGKQYGYLNEDNHLEKTVKEPIDGDSIALTIDYNVQAVVEEKIKQFQDTYRNSFRPGEASLNTAVIVMDPQTGQILSMADNYFYNPNDPSNLSAYFTKAERKAMDEDTRLKELNNIWKNFCITNTFEPGSTVKPMTVAAGLESGAINENDTFYCEGHYKVAGVSKPIGCTGVHEWQTPEQAVMNSCNAALIQIGQRMGKAEFAKYQHIFQFGQKTNIDLPGEESAKGLLYYEDNMKPIDLAVNSFGQSFNVTMMQVAAAYASLINGGYYYQPYLMSRVMSKVGDIKSVNEPVMLRQTVSSQTSDMLKTYLYKTVSDPQGSGKAAKIPGYSMGGKTGTAEKGIRDKINYVKSFIGHVPAQDPKMLIYVVIDSPNTEDQEHCSFAIDLAKEITTDILPYLNIFPDEEAEDTDDGEQEEQQPPAGETASESGQETAPSATPGDGQETAPVENLHE